MSKWMPPGPALLFCPGNRPDRFEKAAERSDAVILDLEDAVPARDRDAARAAIAASRLDPERTIVRVNPVGSPDHEADLACVRETDYTCVMLAKTESAEHVTSVAAWTEACVLALVETPLGVVRAEEIASALGCGGMMWGAEDLVAAMGGRSSRFALPHTVPDASREPETLHAAVGTRAGAYRDVPRYARARVAMAAAAFGRWAVDGVHMDFSDTEGQRIEALDGFALGFAATACIHPDQVPIVREAYTPNQADIDWAQRVLAAEEMGGAVEVDGRMVDGPMYRQAEAIIRRLPNVD
ncbi:CoA ester lyase [Ammonicoccus fulvus]|uniref:CoA ester lyase n=1 Tax=Ammonicoccus fulvus TaxID=3138240 RepID=A0ABZ3FVC3_9ACTN